MWELLPTANSPAPPPSGEAPAFVSCSLLNDWNYFWNEYCNLPFLAISINLPFLASSWYQKANIGLLISFQSKKKKKKKINYHIKGLYKTTCYKTKSNLSQFFFSHWLLHKSFISFLIKAFVYQIDKISLASFHCI